MREDHADFLLEDFLNEVMKDFKILARVKKTVEMHNGEVFVMSKFTVGPSFGFWIPV